MHIVLNNLVIGWTSHRRHTSQTVDWLRCMLNHYLTLFFHWPDMHDHSLRQTVTWNGLKAAQNLFKLKFGPYIMKNQLSWYERVNCIWMHPGEPLFAFKVEVRCTIRVKDAVHCELVDDFSFIVEDLILHCTLSYFNWLPLFEDLQFFMCN